MAVVILILIHLEQNVHHRGNFLLLDFFLYRFNNARCFAR